MKPSPPPTVEDLIIVAALATGWAVLTIARAVLLPLAALVLCLAGWGPKLQAPDRLPSIQYEERMQRTSSDCVVVDHVSPLADIATARALRRMSRVAGLPTITPMHALEHVPYDTLRSMARTAGLPTAGTAQDLRERLALTAKHRNAGGLL